MEPVGVGIIGTGVGRRHALGLVDDPRVEKVVMCSKDEGALGRAAEEVGIAETTTDWQALVERDDLHVISVATPDHLHPEMSIAALRAGKHVLCEKPMAPTLHEAREMVQASEETGKKLMVNHVLRFYARFQKIKALVDSGELGEIYAAEGDYLHNTVDRIRSGWVKTRPSVVTGGGIHLIDQLLWLVGDVEEVFCYSTRGILKEKEVQSPDCMIAILKFKNGCVGKAMTNMSAQRPALHNLVLFGTEGVVMNGKPDGVLYRGHRSEPEAITDAYAPVSGSAKAVGMAHLLDCIEQDTEPLVNVREGARGIAVCDAINESYRTGKPVQVEEV